MQENNPLSGTRDAVARAVRIAMAERKISGRVLSEQIGIPQSVFSRRMTGEMAFTVDQLAAIAAVLGCPLTDLVAGVPADAVAGAA